MNNSITEITRIINECRSEIFDIHQGLIEERRQSEAKELMALMATCGSHFDWMNAREQALSLI